MCVCVTSLSLCVYDVFVIDEINRGIGVGRKEGRRDNEAEVGNREATTSFLVVAETITAATPHTQSSCRVLDRVPYMLCVWSECGRALLYPVR